jgi:hypothetical protein
MSDASAKVGEMSDADARVGISGGTLPVPGSATSNALRWVTPVPGSASAADSCLHQGRRLATS